MSTVEERREAFIQDPNQHPKRREREYSSPLERMAHIGVPGAKGAGHDLIFGVANRARNLNLPLTDKDGQEVIDLEEIYYKGQNPDFQNQTIRLYVNPNIERIDPEDKEPRLIAGIYLESPLQEGLQTKEEVRRTASYTVWSDGDCVGLIQNAVRDPETGQTDVRDNRSFSVKEKTASGLVYELQNCY